ncbi:MAG: very short patch repair endonuclease [Candidatus Gastranaerophilales bacterium]|nr:very short patch repair endonuclease [Candidatus Gastranaerophilales bacterium]
MADIVTPEKRSKMMAGIKGKDTKPEKIIRKGLFARGYRYKLHDKTLPGKPDIIFPKKKILIFVHGCFWHKHNCHLFKWPSSRQDFWKEKIEGNYKRDKENIKTLENAEWRVLIIWECALKGKTKLSEDDALNSIEDWIKSNTKEMQITGRECL